MDFPDVLEQLFGRPHREITEKQLLHHLAKELHAMALDLSKLVPTVAALATAVDTLVNAHTDPAAQAVVDNVVQSLTDITAKATAAAAPAA